MSMVVESRKPDFKYGLYDTTILCNYSLEIIFYICEINIYHDHDAIYVYDKAQGTRALITND